MSLQVPALKSVTRSSGFVEESVKTINGGQLLHAPDQMCSDSLGFRV